MKFSFWFFIANFLFLMKLGSLHPEEPYTTLALMSTIFYFSWFLIIVPAFSGLGNALSDVERQSAGTISPLPSIVKLSESK